jgi:hypothetical protein
MEVVMPTRKGKPTTRDAARALAAQVKTSVKLDRVTWKDAARALAAQVKTSVKLDRVTWKAAHVLAMEQGKDLQTIVQEALDAYVFPGSRK